MHLPELHLLFMSSCIKFWFQEIKYTLLIINIHYDHIVIPSKYAYAIYILIL
jgi:hypothetical protein